MNSAHPGPYAGIPLWLRPITRRPGEVQFGVIEGGAIVTGVTPDEARLLARLDGSLPADALGAVATASGVSMRRWRVLLDLVGRLGLLEPEPVRPALATLPDGAEPGEATANVLIEGDGALSRDLATLLGQDRVGPCAAPGSPAASGSVAAPAAPAAPAAVRWAAASAELGALEREAVDPSAVVLVADIALDPRRGDLWLRRGVPHLPVVTAGSRAVVGPLVDGGPGAPCLWCLDLHRSDRDEAWPTVMAQVAALPRDHVRFPAGPEAGEAPAHPGAPGLAQLVAGTVAALVARSVAGERPPPGVAVEVSLPWPRLDHRRWRPHPRCDRHAFARGALAPRAARDGESGVA
jgi:hypothetical protein